MSKERVKNAISYKKVDHVPAGLFGTSPSYQQRLTEYLGCSTVEDMYKKLGIDIWHTPSLTYKGFEIEYKGIKRDPGHELYMENNPNPPFADISSVEEVDAYQFPDLDAFDGTDLLRDVNEHQEFALCLNINAALFHNFTYMCGQINALCYLKSDPEIAKAIINKITDFWILRLEKTLSLAADKAVLTENCNDFGTQCSLFISPEDFRTFFKPCLKRIYDTAHQHGLYAMQHSCGAIMPIVDDFIEAGADVLNPIQVSATDMQLDLVVEKCRPRIAFYGGIDTQYLLPNGNKEDVQNAVKGALDLFGKDGGYILSGSQGLMDDIPLENAVAMLDPELRA